MKKQIITAAVAAAVVLPTLAQAGVYGRADGIVRYEDSSFSNNQGIDVRAQNRDAWDVGADKFRWGIVGSEDLGNGMSAVYQYEFDMVTAASTEGNGSTGSGLRTRLGYAGLKGNWGALTIGRQWIDSYFAVWGKTDTGDAHAAGPSNFSGNRSGNLIKYVSPSMSGFTAHVVLNVDDDDTSYRNSDGVDWFDLTGAYANGPMKIALTYRDAETGAAGCSAATSTPTCTEYDQWGIGGSYAFGDLTVEGNYGNRDTDGAVSFDADGSTGVIPAFTGTNEDKDAWAIGATYKMGSTHITGAYRTSDADITTTGVTGSTNVEIEDWFIGVRHFMSKETRVFAEYRNTEWDISTTAGVRADREDDMFAFGVRKDWKL